ncbi:hypothetical protein BDL97_08G080800 [Sphagnum fallax]|jgi:mediator of RNA polymerase II transcription subunit 27|nr:hypothetical protein BDL97_08G080800 [Sphagnum fallax]
MAMSISQESELAPPVRLANALEGLGRAVRHIADVRAGADLLLEALDAAASMRGRETGNKKASDGIQKVADFMKKALDELQSTGRELEAAGVLNGAQQRFEENQPWNLQVPLVSHDGALVPYAWKRQIAGQAAASAFDRARLALKAFAEQKRRFFPGLGPDVVTESNSNPASETPKTDGSNQAATSSPVLSDVLRRIQSEMPGMVVTQYARLAWMNNRLGSNSRFDSSTGVLSLSANSSLSLRKGMALTSQLAGGEAPPSLRSSEKVAVLEVTIPGILRAIISLLPPGSVYPDAIAVFSPDERGGHIQAWGVSQHKLHQQLSERAVMVLYQLLQQDQSSTLELLLQWLYSYRLLFTKQCIECKHVMAYDAPSGLLFPPLVRPARIPSAAQNSKESQNKKTDETNADNEVLAYHLGCAPKDL